MIRPIPTVGTGRVASARVKGPATPTVGNPTDRAGKVTIDKARFRPTYFPVRSSATVSDWWGI